MIGWESSLQLMISSLRNNKKLLRPKSRFEREIFNSWQIQ